MKIKLDSIQVLLSFTKKALKEEIKTNIEKITFS